MKYRRFRTLEGQFLDALLTCEGEFSVSAESHKADHEAGYGVTGLTVVEDDSDPWDGVSTLRHAPARPPIPPTEEELLRAKVADLESRIAKLEGTRSA